MEEEEPPDYFGKQAAKAPASLRAKPLAALRSTSGQCQSPAAQQSTPCPPSANTHLPQGEPAEPRAKHQGSLDNQGVLATPEGSSNRLTPSMQCPALSMRSNLLFLSACGLLQLPELRVPASCTPLLSLLPSLASAAVCSQPQAAEHQPQQDGASTYSMYPTAAAAIGAATAAAAMMQQLASMPSTACVERETVQPQLEPASPEGMHTTGDPHPSQPAGQTSGSAEGASKEAHGGALEPLLCSYCGQLRPCAAPCPLGVALAAIQGLHLRGNYCTGRFRVCCYISQPQQQQPQQQQLQEQEVLLSTSQSSPSLAGGTSAADLLPLHQGPQECNHQASAEDPETGVAAAGLQMPLSPASSLVSSTSPDLAAIVAAAAAATVQPSEDGSAAAEIGRAYFQLEDGSVTAGRDGSHTQLHHYCPSLEQPQRPPPQEQQQQQQQQQQGMKAQGCIDGAAQSARWKGPCQGHGEGEVEQQESYLARSIPENQDAAAAVAQEGAHSTRGAHSKKNGMHRAVSFAGNKGEPKKGDRRRSSKTSQGSNAAERPLARAFRSFGNTSTTAAAAASAAELDAIPRSRSFTAESSPEPPGGGPKKMHMQRKGRFLVVSYEDVVSAAKAAALAAIVASADEDHGAAAAAAAATASLTEADTQQLGTSPLVGPHHHQQQQQQQQQQCAPHSVQQQQAQECQRVCEPQSHDSQGSTQAAAAFGAFENAPEPLVIELLQQAPPLHHMHAHAHAHATPARTDAPGAAAPPDSPAAAAAQGAGLSGVAEDGERSAAAAAAAAAMLEHAANVVAGHVLGECDEVISLAHPGVITPSLKTEDLHAPPPPGSLLAATHLGLTSPPHLSRLRHCASSPCLTATHHFDGRLAAQLSDRESSQMPRVFTHVRGTATAPAVPTLPLLPHTPVLSKAAATSPTVPILPLLPQSPVLSKAAAFAAANGPSHSGSTTIGPCSSRCSTTSNSNVTTTTSSPGAASAFLYHPFSASKSTQHAAPDPAVQAASANPSAAAAATTAKSKHSRAGMSTSHEQAANATTSAAAAAAAIAETGYKNAAKPAQSLTQAPPSFNTDNSNTRGPPLPSTPFTTQIHTTSPHPSSCTSPLPSALWVPPSPLSTPPPSPPLPRSMSLSGVPTPHGLPSPPLLPSHSSSPTPPSQSPPAQPSEFPLPKEYKRGRFKVIEVKAAGAASPSSRCTSPLGHPTPTTPSLSPRASSPGLGAVRTSDSAAGTPTRSCSPRPTSPPPPTAFPHPFPLAVAPTALPHQLPPAVALIESLAWDPHTQSVFPPATAMAKQCQPLPAWDSLQSVPPPVPPCSEESGGSASTSSTAPPILSTVLPLLGMGGAPDNDDCDSSAAIAFPDAHCTAAMDAATTTTTDNNFSICNSATSRTPPSADAAAAAGAAAAPSPPRSMPCPHPAVAATATAGAPLPPPPPPPPPRPQSPHLLHAKPLFPLLATLQGDDAGASLACSTHAPPPPALIAPASSEEDCSPTAAHPKGSSFTFSSPSLPSASRPRAAQQQPPADLLKPHYPHLTSCGNEDVLPNPNHSHPHRLHHSTQHLSNAQHADSLFPFTVPPSAALFPPPISIAPCSPQADAEDGAHDSPLSPILLFPSSPSHSVDAAQHSVRGAQQSAGGLRHSTSGPQRNYAQAPPPPLPCAASSPTPGTDHNDAATPLPLLLPPQCPQQLSLGHPSHSQPPRPIPPLPCQDLTQAAASGAPASTAAAGQPHRSRQLAQQQQQQQYQQQQQQQVCANGSAQASTNVYALGSAQAPIEQLPPDHMKGFSASSFSAQAPTDACAWCTAQSPPEPCAPGSAQAPLELLHPEHMKGLSTSSFSAWARGDALGRGSMDEDRRGSSEGNALGRGSIDEDGRGYSEEDGMLPEGPEQEELQQQHPQYIEKLQRQQQQQQQYLQPSHQRFSHHQHQHYQEQRHPQQQQQHHQQQHQGQWHPQQEPHTHHYQEQQQQHPRYQQQHHQQQHKEQWHKCQHPCLHLQQQHHQHHHHQEQQHQPHHHSPLSVQVDLPKGLPPRLSAPSAQQPLSHSSLPASPAAAAEIAATSRAGGCCSASPLLPHSSDYTAAQGQVMESQQQQQQQRHSPQVPVAAAAAGAASKLAAVPDGGDASLAPQQQQLQQQQQQQQQQRGQDPERTSLSTPPSPPSSPALTPMSKAARKVGRFTIREERA